VHGLIAARGNEARHPETLGKVLVEIPPLVELGDFLVAVVPDRKDAGWHGGILTIKEAGE
jgi:hypothetical protein